MTFSALQLRPVLIEREAHRALGSAAALEMRIRGALREEILKSPLEITEHLVERLARKL
jgi:hypothetical protein